MISGGHSRTLRRQGSSYGAYLKMAADKMLKRMKVL